MKKFLALAIVMILIISVMPAAFADAAQSSVSINCNPAETVFGTDNSVTITGAFQPAASVSLTISVGSQNHEVTTNPDGSYSKILSATAANGFVVGSNTVTVSFAGNDDYSASSNSGAVTCYDPSTAVAVPKAKTGLVYNGNEQTGVEEKEQYYSLTGNTATNAGSYTAVATLEDGYVWSDGTKAPKNVPWEIAKKTVKLPVLSTEKYAYTGKAVSCDISESKHYTITGDTQTNVGAYVATVSLNDKTNYCWVNSDPAHEGDDLKLNWIIGYQVTFDPNGGVVNKTTRITDENGYLSKLSTATKTGCSFQGWYTAKKTDSGELVTTDYQFTKNTTVYAQWKISTHTVTFAKYSGATLGKAYYKLNASDSWTELTGEQVYSITALHGATIYFKMVPNTGYYSHPSVYKLESGGYYNVTPYNNEFTVNVTENTKIGLNFSSSVPTGDAGIWQYLVAAIASAGAGTGIVLGYKRKEK